MKRKGSALLIVLGILSFLIVSAVSFSAFMRRARLPSSYLRRDTATRQLAKSAVAQAIDAIDAGIGNAVHPGFPSSSGRNVWSNRVYFADGVMLDGDTTTPVLSLEGLAYLPTPLVNDVRYLQRLTSTAHWQPFGFDVGRYAYLAVDVSDYLDVNRLLASRPRSSASNGRIRATHLFEENFHRNLNGNSDVAWDQWLDSSFRLVDNDLNLSFDQNGRIPFVSLADFHLALGAHGPIGKVRSPFYDYVSGNGNGSFYPADSASELETYSAMTFVTEGLFPRQTKRKLSDGTEIEVDDLGNPENQPFSMTKLKAGKARLSEAVLSQALQTKHRDDWLEALSGVGCAVLMDYLDVDRIPISLAIPTVERVPMICGIRVNLGEGQSGFALRYEPGTETVVIPPDANAERTVEQRVTWKIDGQRFQQALMASYVQALVTYPFLHHDQSDGTNPAARFLLDGRLALFFSTDNGQPGNGMGLRTSSQDVLHLTSEQLPETAITADGVMNIKLAETWVNTVTLKEGMAETEEDAVYASQPSVTLPSFAAAGTRFMAAFNQVGNEFLSITYRWKQRQDATSGKWEPNLKNMQANMTAFGGRITAAKCVFKPLTKEGVVDDGFEGGDENSKLARNLLDATWQPKVRLNAAVWLRVRDDVEGKTVDMVPACYKDDKVQNGLPEPVPQVTALEVASGGRLYPLMCFHTGVELDFTPTALETFAAGAGASMETLPKAVLVPDPRYNYAPEHWFQFNGAGMELTAENWTQNNGLNTLGNGVGGVHRVDDIFMATSDAGYLQSLYELAFLPRLSDLEAYGANPIYGNLGSPSGGTYMNLREFPASIGEVANADMMWVNYDLFDAAELERLATLPFTNEGTGMKVNPYSDSTNVLMAVFANTPVDWRRSSTNLWQGESIQLLPAKYREMKAKDFNEKYAWNGYTASTGGRLLWEDLEEMARVFMQDLRRKGGNWEAVWRDLPWEAAGKPEQIFNFTLSTDSDCLWSCDRRFLYGYWHDCFSIRQQLFLIFVRAEQLMLGGDSAEQLPPQYGARAVALVWRDPEGTSSKQGPGGYPHRTRVLFYHQFE